MIWLINGIPGAGKTTTAHALAQKFPRSVHIEGDKLQDLIVAGKVNPGTEPYDEETRQITLCVKNQCLLGRSFAEAGFEVFIDYVITDPGRIAEYKSHLGTAQVNLITLFPGIAEALRRDAQREKHVAAHWTHLEEFMKKELAGQGLWIDNSNRSVDQVVALILQAQEEARV